MTPDAGGAGAGDGPAHRILGTGLDHRSGGRLVGSFDEREFASGIERSLAENAPRLQAVARATQRATSFRGDAVTY